MNNNLEMVWQTWRQIKTELNVFLSKVVSNDITYIIFDKLKVNK